MDEAEYKDYMEAFSQKGIPSFEHEEYEDELEVMKELEEYENNCNRKEFLGPRTTSQTQQKDANNECVQSPVVNFANNNGTDVSKAKFQFEITEEILADDGHVASNDPEMLSYPKPKKQRVQEEVIEDDVRAAVDQRVDTRMPAFQRYKERERKSVFKLPPHGKDCITITDSEGRRVFLQLLQLDDDKFQNKLLPATRKADLLATSFADVKQIVDEKRHADRLKQIDALKGILKSSDNDEQEALKSLDSNSNDDNTEQETLWVEKYAPKCFTELLSDDGTNRVLLKWLKLWDEFVFGKSRKVTKKQEKGQPQKNEQKRFGKRKQTWDYEEELKVDASGRPDYKIALLSGNPGLGKTTLAHVLANHAGYNPVEMNASDDRSPELFKNKLEASTQMKACMGDEKKPNCLIIDEIDGAPLQAINILMQAAKETEVPSNQKKKRSQLMLRRPVICICNDLYVPALRQLRQIALSLVVPQIIPARLAQRLIEISHKERMRADMACLLALCDKSENDIRSCINTMQFICKKHGTLSAEHLQNLTIGQKDFQKGLFHILKAVFQLPKPSRKPLGLFKHANRNGLGTNDVALSQTVNEIGSSTVQSSNSIRFHNILHLASSNSEHEKMTQGLFDNYLNVKCKDPHLETMMSCAHWLQFADHIDTEIRSNQTFSLLKFLPFLPVAFHMSMAGAMTPKITYTNSMVEFNMKKLKTKQTLEGLVHDVRPFVRRNVTDSTVVTDLLPYLYEVIHPTLRPINIQLYGQNEKQQLFSLISTMISYNLTYHQDRNLDGKYAYTLHPNIEEIIAFPGLLQHKHLSYAAKQLVQREVDLEKMRRVEQSMKSSKIEKKKETSENSSTQVLQTLKAVKPKPIKVKPVLDFFGRVIEPREQTDEERLSEKRSSVINTAVWFKFNEGYTNAVRRTIKVQDFL